MCQDVLQRHLANIILYQEFKILVYHIKLSCRNDM